MLGLPPGKPSLTSIPRFISDGFYRFHRQALQMAACSSGQGTAKALSYLSLQEFVWGIRADALYGWLEIHWLGSLLEIKPCTRKKSHSDKKDWWIWG